MACARVVRLGGVHLIQHEEAEKSRSTSLLPSYLGTHWVSVRGSVAPAFSLYHHRDKARRNEGYSDRCGAPECNGCRDEVLGRGNREEGTPPDYHLVFWWCIRCISITMT